MSSRWLNLFSTNSSCCLFSRSDIAPLLSRGVASHIRLPGPLLPLLLWCLGADQQRSLRGGVSTCWLIHGGDWWVRRAGSLPVAATTAAVHSPAAESTTAAAADPTDPALPATAAAAVSATTGGVSPLWGVFNPCQIPQYMYVYMKLTFSMSMISVSLSNALAAPKNQNKHTLVTQHNTCSRKTL